MLEGTQIAVVRLKEGGFVPPHVRVQAPDIAETLDAMGHDGVALYLIGRQVLVCACVFSIANLTLIKEDVVSPVLVYLSGIVVIVIVGQLLPQLVAEDRPVLFMRVPGVVSIIKSHR
eukprot:UN06361